MTHLRAEEFATNTLFQVGPQIAHGDVVRGAYPDAQSATIHERDIADSVVAVLLEGPDAHRGKTYLLTGPNAESERERVEIVGAVIGRSLTFEEVTPADAVSAMVSSYVPEPIALAAMDELARRTAEPPRITDHVTMLTGRPARTYTQWVTDHAAELVTR
ncbi:hypothetical protein [Microbacterium sp.]|uniref:hypothetical protein n=1 Tax=Microbacterium sp. TaxID=51671 RepID=UPI002FDF4C06